MLFPAGPALAFLLTKRVCLALQLHERRLLEEGEETGQVYQEVPGGMSGRHRHIDLRHRYRFLVRDIPLPLEHPGPGAPSRRRLRAALSAWYYGERVDAPATEEERLRATGRLAGPVSGGSTSSRE